MLLPPQTTSKRINGSMTQDLVDFPFYFNVLMSEFTAKIRLHTKMALKLYLEVLIEGTIKAILDYFYIKGEFTSDEQFLLSGIRS